MRDKSNQLFRDKYILVMLVLGLLAIVATAGAVTVRKGAQHLEESPYLEIREPDGMLIGENELPDVAGDSNAAEAAEMADADVKTHIHEASSGSGTQTSAEEPPLAEEAGAVVADSLALNFTETEKLSWPVQGNVVLSYSMDTTTYFPTLDQYKCNPANLIQSDVSTPVFAPANARVMELGSNEEIGNFIRLDLGNNYTAIFGQLSEIPVVVDEYLEKGALLGYVAEPTRYYTVEGINLYFELQHEGRPIDALDYLE